MKAIWQWLARRDWTRTAAALLAALLLLAALRAVAHAPKPLLVTAAAVLLACLTVSWIIGRRRTDLRYTWIAVVLLCWGGATGLLLGAVHHVDRGGWLWLKLTGYEHMAVEDFPGAADLPIAEFLGRHPQFSADAADSTALVLRQGEYVVRETIVVPRGGVLRIEPGTVVRFGPGCSLVSYRPIHAQGTPRAPIVFTANNPWLAWGVVGLAQTGKSIFQHVHFQYARHAQINGLTHTAGLSLVASDADITHCTFQFALGKDAAHAVRAEVHVRDNLFRDVCQDGFDLDAGRGEISGNQFINCGDDGIDISESPAVRVFGNQVLDARGGRIGADQRLEALQASNTLGYSHSRLPWFMRKPP